MAKSLKRKKANGQWLMANGPKNIESLSETGRLSIFNRTEVQIKRT